MVVYWADPELSRKKMMAYYYSDHEKHRAAQRARTAAAGEPARAKRRAYYAAHREVIRNQVASWKRANKTKVNATNQSRRAREVGAAGELSAGDIEEITAKQGGRCALCERLVKLTIDHIMPLSLGGDHYPGNIQMLCGPCNAAKGARHPSEFFLQETP